MSTLQVGDSAPDFQEVAADGRKVSMADFRGKQAVVLFFYPRDNTSVCTQEACAFRDSYEDFTQAGAAVIGISSDSEARHQGFAEKHRLPFFLISDRSGALRRLFGVRNKMFLIPGRVTFVIDRQGIVRHIFDSLFEGKKHVEEALRIVQELPPK